MSLLSKEDVARYALATGHIFHMMCDEEGCGKLVKPGDMCTVLKWAKRTDGLTFLGSHPTKIRCATCTLERNPSTTKDVKVRGAGRSAKKLPQEEANKLSVNPIVRKCAISLLKKFETLSAVDMLLKLRKKKAVREIKKGEITKSLRSLKKLKVLKFRAKHWSIVVLKPKKVKAKRRQKVLAK